VENSLRWVAARFAQRAVEDFFEARQHREFVIDATMAIEFLAKAVVARDDVTNLYKLDKGQELTTAQRLVLNPALGPASEQPVGTDRDEALAWDLSGGGVHDADVVAGDEHNDGGFR
jgi:hypothetical protein